jgi:hypothetical protein
VRGSSRFRGAFTAAYEQLAAHGPISTIRVGAEP